jgi:hypothetical protein
VKVQATARVQITIEIDCDSRWEEGCEIGQVFKQASESCITKLHNSLKLPGYRIVSQKVLGILTEEPK